MDLTEAQIAQLLRKPDGEAGKQMALKMNQGNAKLITSSIADLDLTDSQSILEIGFGNGKHVEEIFNKSSSLKYTGVDFSETMVNEANEINRQQILKNDISFQLGDVSSLQFKDNTFDRILTVNTIYFWPNPLACMKEILRVLKPKGVVIIGMRPGSSLKEFPFTKKGFDFYEKEDVALLLDQAGFNEFSFTTSSEGTIEFFNKTFQIRSVIAKARK